MFILFLLLYSKTVFFLYNSNPLLYISGEDKLYLVNEFFINPFRSSTNRVNRSNPNNILVGNNSYCTFNSPDNLSSGDYTFKCNPTDNYTLKWNIRESMDNFLIENRGLCLTRGNSKSRMKIELVLDRCDKDNQRFIAVDLESEESGDLF